MPTVPNSPPLACRTMATKARRTSSQRAAAPAPPPRRGTKNTLSRLRRPRWGSSLGKVRAKVTGIWTERARGRGAMRVHWGWGRWNTDTHSLRMGDSCLKVKARSPRTKTKTKMKMIHWRNSKLKKTGTLKSRKMKARQKRKRRWGRALGTPALTGIKMKSSTLALHASKTRAASHRRTARTRSRRVF